MIKQSNLNLAQATTHESIANWFARHDASIAFKAVVVFLLLHGSPISAQYDSNQCFNSRPMSGGCASGDNSATQPTPTCGEYGKAFGYGGLQSSFPSLYGSCLTANNGNSGQPTYRPLYDSASCNPAQLAIQGNGFCNGSYPRTFPPVANSSCGTNGGTGRLLVGFETLWLRANFNHNVAMIIDPTPGNRLVPFDYDFHFSPRASLGWLSPCNGGFRSSYFYYNATAQRETATAVPGATPVYLFVYGAGGNLTRNAYADLGETLSAVHSTSLQALDLEYVDMFSLNTSQLLVGAGLRLAKMGQHLRGDVYNFGGGLEEVVTNELSFKGTGPTFSLQAWRPLLNRRFSAFASPRASLLFAETHQTIYEMKDAGLNEVRDQAHQQNIISVFEMGLGLQYNRCLSNGSSWYVRGGYELQAWHDVGGPIDSTGTLGLDGISFLAGTNW